jgi:hypothetical protein
VDYYLSEKQADIPFISNPKNLRKADLHITEQVSKIRETYREYKFWQKNSRYVASMAWCNVDYFLSEKQADIPFISNPKNLRKADLHITEQVSK